MAAAIPAVAAFSYVMQEYGKKQNILPGLFEDFSEIAQSCLPCIFQSLKVFYSNQGMFIDSIPMIYLIDDQVPQPSELGDETVKYPHLMHLPERIIYPVTH